MNRWMNRIMNEKNMFNVLRAATVAAGVVGTLLALWLGGIGVGVMSFVWEDGMRGIVVCALCFAVLILVSACCYAALAVFYRMCGRLAHGSAFTEENACALGTIATQMLTCGVALLAATLVLLFVLLMGEFVLPMVWLVLITCAFFGVALLSQAMSLLVRRAAALQQESELTI